MSAVPEGEWRLECSSAVFASLRKDPEFAFLVTLARVINALKFGAEVHPTADHARTPVVERRQVGALLYLGGIVHEVLELRKASVKNWGHLPAYQAVFSILDDAMVDKEMAKWLHAMRNRAAFHFDMDIARRTLPTFPTEPFAFIAAKGRDRMDANYELADLVTFVSIFKASANVSLLKERLTRFRQRLDAILPAFIRAADRYMMTRLLELGFTIVALPPGTLSRE